MNKIQKKIKRLGELLRKQTPDRQEAFNEYLQEGIDMENKEKVFSVQQAAEYLGIASITMYNLLKRGKVKAVKTGNKAGRWLIAESSLIEFLQSYRKEGSAKK